MPPNGSEKRSQAGLRVEYRPIEVLIPYARNPRMHSEDQVSQIAASIREFGFTDFALDEITFYLTYNVIYLLSEH